MSPKTKRLIPDGGEMRNASGGFERRHAGTSAAPSHPTVSAMAVPCSQRDAFDATMHPPLSMSASENSPFASGELTKRHVLRPPADSPKSMTRLGSPPKPAMLPCTHASAAI